MVTSGPNGSLGVDSKRGMEIAVADMGGEILGHPIEIVGEDTGCSPEGGQAAASKLASNDATLRRRRHDLLQRGPRRRPHPDRGRHQHDQPLQHRAGF